MVRKLFPTIALNKANSYLDNAGTTLKLSTVIKTIDLFNRKFPLNSHSFSNSNYHTDLKGASRQTKKLIAEWINCDGEEIAFVPSATYALNILALSFSDLLSTNSTIVLTKAEHSSNLYPWIAVANRQQSKIKYLPLNSEFAINYEGIASTINQQTTIVSFAQATNSVGSINNVKEVANLIRLKNPHCFIIVDCCQSISERPIDVQEWAIDALVFSAHKVYGPDGIGVLWVKKTSAQQLPHLLWGGGKLLAPTSLTPKDQSLSYQKFEIGTISTGQVAGLGNAFNFLLRSNWDGLISRKIRLRNYMVDSMLKIQGLSVYNKAKNSSVVIFNIKNFHSHDVASYLADNNIFVRAGDFCSPFFAELTGRKSAIRVSLAIYNNKQDIDKLLKCLQTIEIDKFLK